MKTMIKSYGVVVLFKKMRIPCKMGTPNVLTEIGYVIRKIALISYMNS